MRAARWLAAIVIAVAIVFVIVGMWPVYVNAAEPRGAICGRASWYGPESGSVTASGRRFEPDGLSAAHRSLPFGTVLIVTDMETGRSVRVVVLDRGPAKWTGRVLDLSRGAARKLGMLRKGVARVCARVE